MQQRATCSGTLAATTRPQRPSAVLQLQRADARGGARTRWRDVARRGAHSVRPRRILQHELESVGIRLNRRPPQIYFKRKKAREGARSALRRLHGERLLMRTGRAPVQGGGIQFNTTCELTAVDERLVMTVLHEYKIFNCEVLFREDASIDDFIDVVEGNRVYLKCIYVRTGAPCAAAKRAMSGRLLSDRGTVLQQGRYDHHRGGGSIGAAAGFRRVQLQPRP